MIVQDVAIFDRSSNSWEKKVAENVIQHLFDFKQIKLSHERNVCDDTTPSYGREIFAWIHSIANGWKITDSLWYFGVDFGVCMLCAFKNEKTL